MNIDRECIAQGESQSSPLGHLLHFRSNQRWTRGKKNKNLLWNGIYGRAAFFEGTCFEEIDYEDDGSDLHRFRAFAPSVIKQSLQRT